MPLGEIDRARNELALHSRINYSYRRQQEYLLADKTWGTARRRAAAQARRLFFR